MPKPPWVPPKPPSPPEEQPPPFPGPLAFWSPAVPPIVSAVQKLPPPPPPAITSREASESGPPPLAQLEPHETVLTSEAPPPPPAQLPEAPPLKPPAPTPGHVSSGAAAPPTSTYRVAVPPGSGTVAPATAPTPPGLLSDPLEPGAPTAFISTLCTPAGTPNACSNPVYEYEHVTTLIASEHPDGNAALAEPTNATAHKPNTPTVAANSATTRPRTPNNPTNLQAPESHIAITSVFMASQPRPCGRALYNRTHPRLPAEQDDPRSGATQTARKIDLQQRRSWRVAKREDAAGWATSRPRWALRTRSRCHWVRSLWQSGPGACPLQFRRLAHTGAPLPRTRR